MNNGIKELWQQNPHKGIQYNGDNAEEVIKFAKDYGGCDAVLANINNEDCPILLMRGKVNTHIVYKHDWVVWSYSFVLGCDVIGVISDVACRHEYRTQLSQ